MKKSTIAIVLVVAIVGIAAVALFASSNSNNEKISYNYETKDVSSFNYMMGSYPMTDTPSAGNKFVVAHIIIENTSYSKEVTLSLGLFELKCSNNIKYSYDIDSIDYSSKSTSLYNINLGSGASYDYYVVFEVPIGVTAVGLETTYSYSPYSLFNLNTDLALPAWVSPSWST